jgi:hypothetical protein
MNLSDVAGQIKAARLEEAHLMELVTKYGQREERPKLDATTRQIKTLLADHERIEAEVLAVQKFLGGIYRRDVVSARLAEQHQLSDSQREQLKTALEDGTPESEVSRRASKMLRASGSLGVSEAPEAAQVVYLRQTAHGLAQEFGLSSTAETRLLSSLKSGALSTVEARNLAEKMYLAQRSGTPGAASEESEFAFAKSTDVEW